MGESMQHCRCTLSRREYAGWNTICLSNGLVEIFVVPEIGGRIIQLRSGGKDLFYVNPRHQGRIYEPRENCASAGWKNYGGSKAWPAPQGWEREDQWPGPPDPILDGGAYDLRIVEDSRERVALHLESQPDAYTGLTFSREIQLCENVSAVQLRQMMRNSSSRRVRWSIWQVTQQATDSELLVYAPASRHRQMFGDEPYEQAALDLESGLWKLGYCNQVAKFAVEVQQGWLAAVRPRERIALLEEFQILPDRPYPDGAPAEFWVNGAGTFTLPSGRINMEDDPNGCDPYIETEILSPLIELAPGEEYSFPIIWRLLSSPALTASKIPAIIREALTL